MKTRYVAFTLILFLISGSIFFYNRVIYDFPEHPEVNINIDLVEKIDVNYYRIGNNWLRKNSYGSWECYIEGSAYERGRIIGSLQLDLLHDKEVAFQNEIERNVPNWFLQKILILGLAWFNRDLDQTFPLELRQEIYGISEFFMDDYDYIGPKYNRLINYHAAHDIGHAVQNMRLVGCTSFGTWKNNDSLRSIIVARNFDFYFGDEFARDKIIMMVNPDNGFKFLSVTWSGFIGVVSGMNEKGLGITLNAARSEIPKKSGTPVSIIARDILQNAATIEEALDIAKKHTSFVSESFTISSASDNLIAVIEKSPQQTALYRTDSTSIVVTNHYQSTELKDLEINKVHMKTSESVDRFNRARELLDNTEIHSAENFSKILRDQKGLGNKDIGLSNPKAINQLLAHHAVIFKNMEKLVWVSNPPFQENTFNAYNLNDFDLWSQPGLTFPISIDSLQIAPDPFLNSSKYKNFQRFKELKRLIINSKEALDESLILEFLSTNPEFYYTYQILGDYYEGLKIKEKAVKYFNMALGKDIAYSEDREYMEARLKKLEE